SGYFASVRMHSSRNHTMEQPHNEEGVKMHHVGDGSNFISRSGKEYFDIFPVWDWQKVPGTTTVQKPVHPHWNEIAKKGLTDFVGGVSDGLYGAAAFDFKSAHDPLKARKSWFFFDDEYVCLGSGITAEADYPVFTTLNQCLLNSPVVVKSKKEEVTLEKGKHNLSNVTWILHDGVGYVFSEGQKVNITNTTASGSWREINHQAGSSRDQVHMDVFSLWLDHGVKPQQARYEYIVAPADEAASLDRYSKNSPIEILSNTEEMQAVSHKVLNRSFIVFYAPGRIEVGDHISISAASPCIVMLKTNGKSIEQIAVSDPSRKLEGIQLTTSAMVEGSGKEWKSAWNKKEKMSVIDIELPKLGESGKSVVFTTPGL
ncbi:MAG TPA: polysaccharide lyase family 8 super-sandwich domain-containing protein, partial [Chryseosolibacter sp.]|nr:polysaccharide lyase family 8 super-sandwich domain-containing protein [Chryseosolibacter sp.]